MGLLSNSKSHFGEVFGRTWDHFFGNFWRFFWAAAVLTLIQVIAGQVIQYLFLRGGNGTLMVVGGLLNIIVSIVLGAVLVAGLYHVAKGAQSGKAPAVGESIARGFAGWWKFTLMILRIVWYVIWPVLVAGIIFAGLFYVMGVGTPEASAQAAVEVGDPVVTMEDIPFEDFDFSEFEGDLGGGSMGMMPGVMNPFAQLGMIKSILTENTTNAVMGFLSILILTGLILWRTVKATFAFAVLSDKNGGVNAALKASSEMVFGNWWKVFGNLFFLYVLTLGLFVVVGVGAGLIVGLLLWLSSLVGLTTAGTYVAALFFPLIIAGFSGSIGVLFHYELYKNL